jgi:hypothetical protein
MRVVTISFLVYIIAFTAGCATRKSLTPAMQLKEKAIQFPITDTFLTQLLSGKDALVDTILGNPDPYRFQVIYTEVNRDRNNKPLFTNHYFNLDPGKYFYPASTVKMPTAFLALQRLNELKIPGLDKNTSMITETAAPGQTPVLNDPTTPDGRPSIAHYIKKIFLVSDNDAFNRIYEFLGQEYINNSLHSLGYDSVQILHRLQVSMSEQQHRATNPIRFFDTSGNVIHEKPAIYSNMPYQKRSTFLGKGYYRADQLINEPFDFSARNRISLIDLHSILQSVIFPEALPAANRFNLSEEDYQFLYKYMSMKPGESLYPSYDSTFSPAYSKLLLFGGKGDIPGEIRIFNKEGDAYGFLTDVAYVVDFKNKVEFFLSATLLCNSDGIFNDDHYDYNSIGFPFLQHLGQIIYNHELNRKKKHVPDLSKFKIDYSN